MKKNIFLVLLLVVSNLAWFINYFFSSIDNGLKIEYLDASLYDFQKNLDQAVIIANKKIIGLPVSEAKDKIGQDAYGLEPFVKEGCLHAGGLCLVINGEGEISEVRAE